MKTKNYYPSAAFGDVEKTNLINHLYRRHRRFWDNGESGLSWRDWFNKHSKLIEVKKEVVK
jgi:hypothetical protein